jgi:hypothetical protein
MSSVAHPWTLAHREKTTDICSYCRLQAVAWASCTGRQVAQAFFDAAGRHKRLAVIPRPLIVALGVFSPLLREVVEMLYQDEEPYVVDGSEFADRFDFRPTPLGEGARRTLAWYQRTYAADGSHWRG